MRGNQLMKTAKTAVSVAGLLLAAGCSGASTDAAGPGSAGVGAPGTAVSSSPGNAGVITIPTRQQPAVAPTGVVTLEPSAGSTSALAQATPMLARYPGATVEEDSPSGGAYEILDAETSGVVRYVDVDTVVFVCGPGIADDCSRFPGTPKLRIPLAPNAAFLVLGTDMRPTASTNFDGLRKVIAPGGNAALFEIKISAGGQATSFTAVYTP